MQNSLSPPPVPGSGKLLSRGISPVVCSASTSTSRSSRSADNTPCEHQDSVRVSLQHNRYRSRESLSSISCHFETGRVRSDSLSNSLASILLTAAAACAVILGSPFSAEAGILSGLESFQVPSLPSPDVLKKIQEANVEKYKAFDSNFKKSPFLQELLKKSKENKELHRKEIEDKYCERGAEWGVGDCSLIGLPQADRDAFFEKLKEGKRGK